MPSDRKYSDEEVSLILRKAADLQVQGAARAEGLTLESIQEIAREVGIRAEVVAEAAAIVAHGNLDFSGGKPSSDVRYRLELFSPGDASQEQLAEMPSVIRQVMQHQGRVTEVLGSIEWSTVQEPSQVAVVIRKSENGTRIEVAADRSGAAVLTFLPTSLIGFLAGAAVSGALDPSLPASLAVFGGGIASGACVGWAIWRRNTARFRRKMLRLAEALRAALRTEDEPPL